MSPSTAVNCYQCGVLTSLLEQGLLHVHFPNNAAIKPCFASWRRARRPTYPFELLDDDLATTPKGSV